MGLMSVNTNKALYDAEVFEIPFWTVFDFERSEVFRSSLSICDWIVICSRCLHAFGNVFIIFVNATYDACSSYCVRAVVYLGERIALLLRFDGAICLGPICQFGPVHSS